MIPNNRILSKCFLNRNRVFDVLSAFTRHYSFLAHNLDRLGMLCSFFCTMRSEQQLVISLPIDVMNMSCSCSTPSNAWDLFCEWLYFPGIRHILYIVSYGSFRHLALGTGDAGLTESMLCTHRSRADCRPSDTAQPDDRPRIGRCYLL